MDASGVLGESNAIFFKTPDGSTENIIYTATWDALLSSSDYCSSWDTLQAPIIPYSIAIAADDPNLIYIADETGVFRSDDRGLNWTAVGLAGFNKHISLFIDPTNSQTVYARMADYGIYKTTNGGSDWVEKNTGLASTNYNSPSVINPLNTAEIFIAEEYSIYRTINGGDSWELFTANPESAKYLLVLEIDTVNMRLLAGGSAVPGVYSYQLSSSSTREEYSKVPVNFDLK